MRKRALVEYEDCAENPTSGCFARLRLEEETGLYFPFVDENEDADEA